MTDSFFGFDTTLEGDNLDESLLSEEDEEDYDALNDETFGDGVITGDWEEDHEKLAVMTELSRHNNVISENGDLSSKLAAHLWDEDFLSSPESHLEPPLKPKTRPPPGFSNSTSDQHDVKLNMPSLKYVCTVEELERNLIKPTSSLRLEDLERNLISKPNPSLLNLKPPGAGFINVPQHHPVLNNQISKIPPLVPFAGSTPIQPFLMQNSMLPGLSGLGRVSVLRLPHPMGPGRGPPLGVSPPRPSLPPEDEYAGIMTSKEKQWLASIQLLQLNSTHPFQDDYYFTMYQLRQSGNHGRKIGNSLKNARETPSLLKTKYTPLQFENSLGKLQVGSVMAPRKIIDTDIVESVECSTSQNSSKKLKQILLEIEQMFSSILLAEDVLSPLSANTDESVNPGEIFQSIVTKLLKDDELKSFLAIRKGKTLILRILPHTDVSGPLAHKLITIIFFAAQKDPEQALLRALPAIRHYLGTCSLKTLVELSSYLRPHISFLLPNKFGISVLANMIERAEFHLSQDENLDDSNEWINFVTHVLSLCQSCHELERPVVGIHGPTLAKHLSRCTSANNHDNFILQKALSNLSTMEKL